MVREKEKGLRSGPMERSTKEIGSKIMRGEMASLPIRMEIIIKDSGFLMKHLVTEYINKKMDVSIKAIGHKISNMVKANKLGRMEVTTKDSTNRE